MSSMLPEGHYEDLVRSVIAGRRWITAMDAAVTAARTAAHLQTLGAEAVLEEAPPTILTRSRIGLSQPRIRRMIKHADGARRIGKAIQSKDGVTERSSKL